MQTQKAGLFRAVLLLTAAVAVLLPHGTAAAQAPKDSASEGELGMYQTKIVVDDHCPPTIITSYNAQTGVISVAIDTKPTCPIGLVAISAYDLDSSTPERIGFTRLPVKFSLRRIQHFRYRSQAIFVGTLKPGSTGTDRTSLLMKVYYEQNRAMDGGRVQAVKQTVYTTALLTDTVAARRSQYR